MKDRYFDSAARFYSKAGGNLMALSIAPVTATCKLIFNTVGDGEVDGLFSLALCAASLCFTVPLSIATTGPLAFVIGLALLATVPFVMIGATVMDAMSPASPAMI